MLRRTCGEPRYHDVKLFLNKGTYPSGASVVDRRMVRCLAFQFFLSGDLLYKRFYGNVLLCKGSQ